MYPPPDITIIRKLWYSDLESISHGLSTVHFQFANSNGISFSAPFRFGKIEDYPTLPVVDFPLKESQFVRVLGDRINDCKCEEDGTLELKFSAGDILTIYANDPAYEAYTLLIDGKEYVI